MLEEPLYPKNARKEDERRRDTREQTSTHKDRLREGVKVTDQSVNGVGGQPQSATKIVFFYRKENKMQNGLKRKNMYYN